MFQGNEYRLKDIKWDGEGTVVMDFDSGDGITGMQWAGAKRKDFWQPDKEWEKILVPGVKIKLWSVQGSCVVGFQYHATEGELNWWDDVWCTANNFQTKAEREKNENAYVHFIEDEGKLMAKKIDEGMAPADVISLADKEHTGNTMGIAVMLAIKEAKNRDAAEAFRLYWNKYWGCDEDKAKGRVVNPAILVMEDNNK